MKLDFCKGNKVISTSLSSNTERDDIRLVLSLIFQPWNWKNGETIKKIEKEFKDYLKVKHAFSFNSGRSCLMAILESMEVGEGDEVLLQGFTCSSAVIPILQRKAKPVFVDIDSTLNLDPEALERKITSKSRVVMIQHTFGYPAKIKEVLKIVKKHNLLLIEDCAHALGSKYAGRFCGTFGDAAFFSFGRDKVISSVFGGMAVINNDDLVEKVKDFKDRLEYPSSLWIFQQLLHPLLVGYLVLPSYRFPCFGKLFLGLLHKTKLLSKAVYDKEKEGKMSKHFPKKMANAFSVLALNQLRKINRLNAHRKKITLFYEKELKESGFCLPFLEEEIKERDVVFMRYPVLVEDSDELLKCARKKKVLLNDGWRKSPVVPLGTDLEKVGYFLGSCKKAEKIAESILNLPTHINISIKKAEAITRLLKDYDSKRNKR